MAIKRSSQRDPWDVFLTELGRHGSERKALAIAGLTRPMLREKLRDDDEFHILVADSKEDAIDRIEETAFTTARIGDTQMMKFILETRRYKKTSETTIIPPSINITIGGKRNDKSE